MPLLLPQQLYRRICTCIVTLIVKLKDRIQQKGVAAQFGDTRVFLRSGKKQQAGIICMCRQLIIGVFNKNKFHLKNIHITNKQDRDMKRHESQFLKAVEINILL